MPEVPFMALHFSNTTRAPAGVLRDPVKLTLDLLMLMIGGHVSGVLWGRLAFSFIMVGIIVRISSWLPRAIADRFLWGEPSGTRQARHIR